MNCNSDYFTAWKNYVDELNEAKLRALGVSSHDDEPSPLPSVSPSSASRMPSSQHPGQPFSPPIPPSSASSNPFPFGAAPFAPPGRSSSVTSPGIQTTTSPFGPPGKFNPRQSISIPASSSPFQIAPQSSQNWAQQALLLQNASRGESPLGLNGLVSPASPFQQGITQGFNTHQRHQSLQYPLLPHQVPHFSQRGTPTLQELQEVDEEAPSKSPSKTPEPPKHNADGLQAEIDDAEYHLEEQLRNELEHEDYSPHNENKTNQGFQFPNSDFFPTSHGHHQSVQFTLPEQVVSNSGPGPVLHHPRPHSRGQSLGHNFFMNQNNGDEDHGFGDLKLPGGSNASKSDDVEEIQTNPSNLGTPVQDFDLAGALQQNMHQRAFSTASNPWADVSGGSNPASRRMSHTSKASLSKLNVEAPEFKFNPESSFKPGQFVFGGNTFQPQPTLLETNPVVQPPQHSATSSFSMSTGSKINANAPVFSPGQSEFSFSTSGPKFRPDAPAFMPFGGNISDAITSPPTGSESGKREGSIFGNIEIPTAPDVVKPAKRSKAIPIVRPPSRRSSPTRSTSGKEDKHDSGDDEARVKRARASRPDSNDAVPLFDERSNQNDGSPSQGTGPEKPPQPDAAAEHKAGDEGVERANAATSSVMASDAKEAKPTAPTSASSPSGASPHGGPFEFENKADMQNFNQALPVGEKEPTLKRHKKSLSATAKPFTPGLFTPHNNETGATGGDEVDDKAIEDVDVHKKEEASAATFNPAATEFKPERFNPAAAEFAPRTSSATANAFESGAFNPAAADFEPRKKEPETDQPRQSVEVAEEEAVDEKKSAASTPPPPVLHRVPQGLASSRFASPPPKPKGLAASRFASSPTPEPLEEPSPVSSRDGEWEPEKAEGQISPPEQVAEEPVEEPPQPEAEHLETVGDHSEVDREENGEVLATTEPTLEEIDAIMHHINENDPHKGVKYHAGSPQLRQPSPPRQPQLTLATSDTPFHLPPAQHFRSDAPSPSPRRYRALPGDGARPSITEQLDDPFIERAASEYSYDGAVHQLNSGEVPPTSEWDEDFSEAEHYKLENRVQFFDGRVNDIVDMVLSSRLDPVEQSLNAIQRTLSKLSGRGVSVHRERRSTSRESDADDEDDEPVQHRSMSPQRSKRVEQIRSAVLDALASHQRAAPPTVSTDTSTAQESAAVLKALEEMKEQFGTNMRHDFRGEDLRNIVEEAVERRMPQTLQPNDDTNAKLEELQAKVVDLEQRLNSEQMRAEKEIEERRAAQDKTAKLQQALQAAETKVEMEIMNRSIFDQRVTDLEDKLKHQEQAAEDERNGRRVAEDRLSEVQRLLRISTDEENRLRDAMEEKDQRIKALEQASGKTTMRLSLLDAAQANATQSQSELTNKLNVVEGDLRAARQEVNHWRLEAERTAEGSRRLESDLTQALTEKKHLQKLLDTLGTQLEENERLRDTWRNKFVAIQEEMARAASQITEENARRTKREQALIARHEVLDAKLQAEARTRERLEQEMERLEGIERQGMRAATESKRLEGLLGELRTENHRIHQAAMRYQRELEDAREAAANEVQRVRVSMQTQLDDANARANREKEDLEEQISKLRGDLDQARIDVDTAKAQTEMLLEEAQATKDSEIRELTLKHQNELEEMQTRHDRQLSNAVDEAQTSEQRLLERLSISTSRTEHLQDRIIHLEEKLEIAKEAARAAAQAAKVPSPEHAASPPAVQAKPSRAAELPEKISPQALRESIMVLQEQLQEREQRIEELQRTIANLDPDASTKIAKRDDEIIWLRELLAVRHGDLQDIIASLSTESYDKDRVRDAVIRLQANLQMEEQERERAMNGGSSVRLPNIAQTIRDAATPRVAQAVGPIAAAWGNWRKAQPSFGSLSGALVSPASRNSRDQTPSKATTSTQNKAVGGLLTPPASGVRQTPPTTFPEAQPAAFTASSRRFTGQRSDQRQASISSRRSEKMAMGTPPRQTERAQPATPPPMMERSGYDSDANPAEFDDHGFFDDDD